MRRLAYRAEFDGVVCLFTSFGYFSERENVDTLRRWRARSSRVDACSSITAIPHHDA